jgi:hypothetical protein
MDAAMDRQPRLREALHAVRIDGGFHGGRG